MLIEIKSWISGATLHTIKADSIKLAVEALVRQGASLNGASLDGASLNSASLNGASLNRASLNGAFIGDLICLTELADAIDLAPMIWAEWQGAGFYAAKKRFGLHQVLGEEKALIAMCPLLIGGFCFVLHRREIWWWSWRCPNPETVPVLWREEA